MKLDVFIGRWITEGETTSGARIVASDVYEWAPGGKFVIHPAYGRIGDHEVGGLEVITPDPENGQYRTHFFDAAGHVTQQTLSFRDGAWHWQGPRTRATGVFEDGGRTLVARHERSEDGVHWTPSMIVTLRKIG